jgi:hypothetical protein
LTDAVLSDDTLVVFAFLDHDVDDALGKEVDAKLVKDVKQQRV